MLAWEIYKPIASTRVDIGDLQFIPTFGLINIIGLISIIKVAKSRDKL